MPRWVCPRCGNGVNGPVRPRTNDVRRYCLTCSGETGRLVERSAPALERKRSVRAAALAQKRQTKAQRAKAAETAYYTIAGVDLRKEMKRLVKLPAFGGPTGRLARLPPELKITRRRSVPSTQLASADPYAHVINLSEYPGIDAADIRETLVHELVHIYLGYRVEDHRRWHGEKFHLTHREAFREAYGVTPLGAQDNSYHGRYARALRIKEGAPDAS